MGYGLGAALVAIGLILALAVTDSISGVDLTTIGWILTIVGAVVLVLNAVTLNRRRGATSVQTTTDSTGRQSVRESRSEF